MPEIQTAPQPANIERREADPVKELWRESNKVIAERAQGAQAFLHRQGIEDPAPDHVRTTAISMQRHLLDHADTDEWSTSYLTTQRVALMSMQLKPATEAFARQELQPAAKGSELRAQRVATLVNFNHDLAASLGCMSPRILRRFPEELVHYAKANAGPNARFAQELIKVNTAGVAGEVAFNRALQAEMPGDIKFRHATAVEDARGVDAVITDNDGTVLNIDFKRANAFNQAIDEQLSKGAISKEVAATAWQNRYLDKRHGIYGSVCLTDVDSLGTIENFEYTDPEPVAKFVQERLTAKKEEKLRNLSKNAINVYASH